MAVKHRDVSFAVPQSAAIVPESGGWQVDRVALKRSERRLKRESDMGPERWDLGEYFPVHAEAMGWLAVVGVFVFVASLITMPLLIIRLPVDYFKRRPIRGWPTRHPVIHVSVVVLKNVIGTVLLLSGVAMLVLPGQGLLTILMGVILIDFPRKRSFEMWLIRHRPLLRAANWIRQKNRQPPFDL